MDQCLAKDKNLFQRCTSSLHKTNESLGDRAIQPDQQSQPRRGNVTRVQPVLSVLEISRMASPALSNLSFLQIVDLCDNVELRRDAPDVLYDAKFPEVEQLVPFALTDALRSPIVGLLRPAIIQQLVLENKRSRELGNQEVWNLRLNKDQHRSLDNGRSIGPLVSFNDWVDDHSKRTATLAEICQRWRDTGLFSDVCGPKKWRNEMYAVYADPFAIHDHPNDGDKVAGKELNYVFEMERSACGLFGVITYGVHMSIYEEDIDESGRKSLRVWVPTRALTKPT